MHLHSLKFGNVDYDVSTTIPLFSGPVNNRPANYTTEVKYENIEASVNVTKAKESPATSHPIKGSLIEGVPLNVVAMSEGSTLHAVKKRCDHRPQPNLSDLFNRGHEILMARTPEREEIRMDEGMVRAYLDGMSGQKRDRLGELLDSADFTLPGYTDKIVFAKAEALVKHDGAQPRVVYQGGDMYNLTMGSVVYHLTDRIREGLSRSNPLNKGNEVIYCVGLTADQIGELIHNTPGEAVENDFKNNDGTQPAGVREKEAMYYYKNGAPKWFVREFAKNTSVRVFTRYGVKGKVNGGRWSGEVTTTPGNGYVNTCISLAALELANIQQSTTYVYGDDNLTYTKEPRRKELAQGFNLVSDSIGMTAEVKVVEHREQATFLRKRFCPNVNETMPVPSFGRVLVKLPVRANFNKSVSDREYMAGKVLSAAYEHRHIESLRTLLLETADSLSLTPHLDMRNQAMAFKYTAEELKTMTSKAKVVDRDYFHSFLANVYGVTEDELLDAYQMVMGGILVYADVNSGKGRDKHNSRDGPLLPNTVTSTTLEALVSVDVSL